MEARAAGDEEEATMTTTGGARARLLPGSADKDKIRAKHDRDPDMAEQPSCVDGCPANLDSCTAPMAPSAVLDCSDQADWLVTSILSGGGITASPALR